MVFMLFLMKINLKSYLVFNTAILNAAILKDDERG
ncbi:hypothetical protein HPLT_05480 [Helicobacter pylori Lithuania75]|nr:hypothetical protein HPLT_05480 [Helicobacter pylori Lithuania75]